MNKKLRTVWLGSLVLSSLLGLFITFGNFTIIPMTACFAGTAVQSRGDADCILPDPPEVFVSYMKEMKERFYRNLPKLSISKDVTIRFFLTSKGFVRDVSLVKSSGDSNVDLACIDAAYCASPLATPPLFRCALRPPPGSSVYEPNDYGEGTYTFTFNKSEPRKGSSDQMAEKYIPLAIPKEVLFRYPGLFKLSELQSTTNLLVVDVNPTLLELIRFPWSVRYTGLNPASKDELQKLSGYIFDKYIGKKGKTVHR